MPYKNVCQGIRLGSVVMISTGTIDEISAYGTTIRAVQGTDGITIAVVVNRRADPVIAMNFGVRSTIAVWRKATRVDPEAFGTEAVANHEEWIVHANAAVAHTGRRQKDVVFPIIVRQLDRNHQ